MQKSGYKFLLQLLKGLVVAKQSLIVVLKKLKPIIYKLVDIYNKTIGFWLYKLYFYTIRRVRHFFSPWKQNFFEIFSKRSTLQVVFFLLIFLLIFPYTRIYTQAASDLPGRDTLLYSIAGPGDQDFSLDEVQAIVTKDTNGDLAPWQESAINIGQQGISEAKQEVQEIAGLGAGGTALQNPTIISGEAIKQQVKDKETSTTKSRGKVIKYQVRSGDTIGRIAESYEISVETILWANNLTSRSYIRPGDVLNILPTTGVLHKVIRGDNLSKIAKKYQTETNKIIKANKLQNDGSDIVIGEELVIPDGRKTKTYVARKKPSRALGNISAPPPSVSAPAGSGYIWPTSVRRITQYFGWRHDGLDIAGPIGTPLYAVRDGRVIKSQCGWNGGYGCHVRVDHGGGVVSLYAHAHRLLVKPGDRVTQGQVIALMGSTGRSTGPHIHFEIRVNNRHQNPFRYVR